MIHLPTCFSEQDNENPGDLRTWLPASRWQIIATPEPLKKSSQFFFSNGLKTNLPSAFNIFFAKPIGENCIPSCLPQYSEYPKLPLKLFAIFGRSSGGQDNVTISPTSFSLRLTGLLKTNWLTSGKKTEHNQNI